LSLTLRGAGTEEDELKCAALLAFVQNAHWPDPAAPGTPLTVGVVGRPAFLRWLHTAMDGKAVEGRPLRVEGVSLPIDPHLCQVVYFASDKPAEIKTALQALGPEHVLTVGENDRFLEQGGAVNLFLVDGHMAFEVSLGALDRSGVAISSKLLRFGQIRDLAKGRPRQ
jgi:hypothetical protein